MDLEKTINLIVEDLQSNATTFDLYAYEVKATHQIIRKHLTKQCVINGVVKSKITALVTYWKWQESGHLMLDDSKNKTSEVVEVEKLTDINQMFTNIIDIKILK